MFFGFRGRLRRKIIFSISFAEHKTSHLSYSIYKHDAIDLADPSNMQICHTNFLIDLAHRWVSEAQW